MRQQMARPGTATEAAARRNGTRWHGLTEGLCEKVAEWRRNLARGGTNGQPALHPVHFFKP